MQSVEQQDFSEFEDYETICRRKLLPWYIRFFSWAFMIMGAFAIPVFFILFFKDDVDSSLLNLDSVFPLFGKHLSALLMIMNGFAGFCLWTERKQAIKIGVACAIVNLIITIISMVLTSSTDELSVRFEIVLNILFIVRLMIVKRDWENTAISRTDRD